MPSILIDSTTGAPYVPLPHPFSEFRLTLPSLADAESTYDILRHGSVAQMCSNVPEPYTLQDAHNFLNTFKVPVLDRLKDVNWSDSEQVAQACRASIPFTALRDGTGAFVGDVSIRRNVFEWMEIDNPEEMRALCKQNAERIEGDPEIRYSIGYYLSPTSQAKGLMTTAVRVSIDLARQYMGLRHLQGDCGADNPASRRVLEKNGLRFTTEARMMLKGTVQRVVVLDCVFDSWQPESWQE